MANPVPLRHDAIYHIYNRGNNGANLFIEERNCDDFLQLYVRHVHPVVDTYAYRLLQNRFHVLVKVKLEGEVPKRPSPYFANLLNAYAKGINRAYGRSGLQFERPFERLEVTNEGHLVQLVMYIHVHPGRHGFVDDPAQWPFSSYDALRTTRPPRLRRDVVLDWFGSQRPYVAAHKADIGDLSGVPDLTGLAPCPPRKKRYSTQVID